MQYGQTPIHTAVPTHELRVVSSALAYSGATSGVVNGNNDPMGACRYGAQMLSVVPVNVESTYLSETPRADENEYQTYETRNDRFDCHADDAQNHSVNLGLSRALSPQVDEH